MVHFPNGPWKFRQLPGRTRSEFLRAHADHQRLARTARHRAGSFPSDCSKCFPIFRKTKNPTCSAKNGHEPAKAKIAAQFRDLNRFVFLETETLGKPFDRLGLTVTQIKRYKLLSGQRTIYYTFELSADGRVARLFFESEASLSATHGENLHRQKRASETGFLPMTIGSRDDWAKSWSSTE